MLRHENSHDHPETLITAVARVHPPTPASPPKRDSRVPVVSVGADNQGHGRVVTAKIKVYIRRSGALSGSRG